MGNKSNKLRNAKKRILGKNNLKLSRKSNKKSVKRKSNTKKSVKRKSNTKKSVKRKSNTKKSVKRKSNTKKSVKRKSNTKKSVKRQPKTFSFIENLLRGGSEGFNINELSKTSPAYMEELLN